MTYRDAAAGPSAPPPLRFFRLGPVARTFLAILGAAGIVFALAMATWTTQDSYLDCTRSGGAAIPTCAVNKLYPFSILVHEALAPIRETRVDERIGRGRGGSYPYLVLVLEHADGQTTEIPGIGQRGARAPVVSGDVNVYLSDDSLVTGRWHLRESAYPVTALMLALAALAVVLIGSSFRRTHLTFDPATRQLIVCAGRWPLRAQLWQLRIDDIERVERIETVDRNGVSYSIRFATRDNAPSGLLGIMRRTSAAMDVVVSQLEAALSQWRR